MTVLVTGANGFVGSAVAWHFAANGRLVRRAVRHADNRQPNTVRVGEIDAGTDWRAALDDVDTVVHCAARVHQMNDRDSDPLTAFRRVNTDGTAALARQAAEAGVRRLIFLSSVKVNGEATALGRPFTAADAPAPADPYGVSKLGAEYALASLATAGMATTVIRAPLVYGPGVAANFAALIRFVRRGVPLPLGAVTDNRRSMVALDNLVDFIAKCEAPAAAGQTFLVSDGEDLSTRDLITRLAGAAGVRARLWPVPPSILWAGAMALGRRNAAKRLLGSLQVDITATRERLGWTPPIGIDEAFRRAVAG